MHILTIFIGGGLGSLARYFLTVTAQQTGLTSIPMGTLLSNIIASFILGYLSMLGTAEWSPSIRLGWMVGFCGGFSTFSTFTAENYILLESGNYISLALNITASILLCLLFFFWGYKFAV